jgi:choline-glycine betaine transporter
VVLIWTFIIYSLSERALAFKEFQLWFRWVTDEWTWLYIGSQNIWIAVLLYILAVPKYRAIRLGKDEDRPEFSDVQWFAMLFCCGVAVGLWYFGVSEPMWHFHGWGGARWMDDNNWNDNNKANHALMMTYFHWGLHGWIPYVVIAALLSIMSYRRGLPLTMRSCFYPLWGKGIEGWRGDVVDVLSIMCTLFGVCTSLGIGVRQLNRGLMRLDRGTYAGNDLFGSEWGADHRRSACDNDAFLAGDCTRGRLGIEFTWRTQVGIIVCVTFLATCSVMTGIKRGIATLSYIAFSLGMLILMAVLFMDDTMYILDAITSSFGYYLWYLPKLAWETDAWARLGAQNDWQGGKSGGIGPSNDEFGPPDGRGGGQDWMHSWTIFYWGWWISWAPFVGQFVARISKGRTLGSLIVASLLWSTMYCVLWFGVFGGAAINMQFAAIRDTDDGDCGFSPTQSTRLESNGLHAKHNRAYTVNLWCLDAEDALFDMMGSYGTRQLSYALTGFAWLGLLLYFITSSDSGSFVIDMIAANGDPNPPKMQRLFWALSEGAAAIALLVGSRNDPERALDSVSAVSVVAGLPFTIVLMYMVHALYYAVKEEVGELDEDRKNFATGCVPEDVWQLKNDAAALVEAAVLPSLGVKRTLDRVGDPLAATYAALHGALWVFAVALLALSPLDANLRMCAAAVYLGCATVVAYARRAVRTHCRIEHGDLLTDACIGVLFYPFAIVQHEKELDADAGDYDKEAASEK